MNSARFNQILDIFQKASELKKSARERYLAKACGDDGELLKEVRAMLEHDTPDDDFIESSHPTTSGLSIKKLGDTSQGRTGALLSRIPFLMALAPMYCFVSELLDSTLPCMLGR